MSFSSQEDRIVFQLTTNSSITIYGDIFKLERGFKDDEQTVPRGIYKVYQQDDGWFKAYLISKSLPNGEPEFLFRKDEFIQAGFEWVMTNPNQPELVI